MIFHEKTTSEIKLRKAPLITRFAPSPTGYLHLGHIASCIYVWGIAKTLGAKIILRIEDHDRGRSRDEFTESILRDLEWLGFEPDEGFSNVNGASPYRQSDQLFVYEELAKKLHDSGKAFYCKCSRKELSGESRYPGTCRLLNLKPDVNVGMRLLVKEAKQEFFDGFCGNQNQSAASESGDFLLKERGGNYTYNFCVVKDDLDQRVNLVIRGQDLLESTGRQIYLANLISDSDKKTPQPFYFHHPLLVDESGEKLAKRKLSVAVSQLRLDGTPRKSIFKEAFAHMRLRHLENADSLRQVIDVFSEELHI